MRCILFDHKFELFAGHGDYAGQTFMICIECGKTMKADTRSHGAGEIAYFDDFPRDMRREVSN